MLFNGGRFEMNEVTAIHVARPEPLDVDVLKDRKNLVRGKVDLRPLSLACNELLNLENNHARRGQAEAWRDVLAVLWHADTEMASIPDSIWTSSHHDSTASDLLDGSPVGAMVDLCNFGVAGERCHALSGVDISAMALDASHKDSGQHDCLSCVICCLLIDGHGHLKSLFFILEEDGQKPVRVSVRK